MFNKSEGADRERGSPEEGYLPPLMDRGSRYILSPKHSEVIFNATGGWRCISCGGQW